MILFFRTPTKSVIATEVNHELASEDIQKLSWLYGEATVENEENLKGCFIGPRREMITPWSTNAVEITQNMGLTGIQRIEEYFPVKDENAEYDPMLQRMYKGLNQVFFDFQQVVHFFTRKCKTFFFIIFFQILNVNNRLRFNVNSENLLVQSFIHAL